MPGRSLLDLDELDTGELNYLLDRAKTFAAEPDQTTLLHGVPIVNLFFEPSTRTFTSFSIAESRLGATVVALPPKSSSLGKGETIGDTAVTLAAMGVRVIVTRHEEAGFPNRLAESFSGHVVNAGDGRHAHPTQALLDLRTMKDEFGRIEGLHVAIAGDVLHSRVARSNIIGLKALGARVSVCGPAALVPDALAALGVDVVRDFDALLPTVDVVMLLRVQRERLAHEGVVDFGRYERAYRLDAARLERLQPHAIVLHPGPFNRGIELTDDVTTFPRWRYERQVENGVPIRMAVLDWLVNG
jgi:aspartate carbamoyltransferase catalytic subunit